MKPLAGARYFHALGVRQRANRASMSVLAPHTWPLWARNAYAQGRIGVGLRRTAVRHSICTKEKAE